MEWANASPSLDDWFENKLYVVCVRVCLLSRKTEYRHSLLINTQRLLIMTLQNSGTTPRCEYIAKHGNNKTSTASLPKNMSVLNQFSTARSVTLMCSAAKSNPLLCNSFHFTNPNDHPGLSPKGHRGVATIIIYSVIAFYWAMMMAHKTFTTDRLPNAPAFESIVLVGQRPGMYYFPLHFQQFNGVGTQLAKWKPLCRSSMIDAFPSHYCLPFVVRSLRVHLKCASWPPKMRHRNSDAHTGRYLTAVSRFRNSKTKMNSSIQWRTWTNWAAST